MIRSLTILALLASTGLSLAASPFDYLRQSLERIVAAATVVNLADYDYRASGSLYGYFLDPNAENGLIARFEAGREYLILGGGDQDVLDLDLVITEVGNRTGYYDRDIEHDPHPVLSFRPPRTGDYEIRLLNVQSRGPSFCSFVILEQTGRGRFSLNELAQALEKVIFLGDRASELVTSTLPRNNLVLFGGRLVEGQVQTTFDLQLPAGVHTALSSGSEGIIDLDLAVRRQYQLRSPDGPVIGSDDDAMPIAVAPFATDYRNRYAITMLNYHSSGPGFAFTLVLQTG